MRGRLFSAAKLAGRPTVAVVDEAFVRRNWEGTEPLGRTLRIGADSVATVVTVIGVVPERREGFVSGSGGVVFIPGHSTRTHFCVRTLGDATPLVVSIREAIREVDPRVPVLWVRTFEDAAARGWPHSAMLASGLASSVPWRLPSPLSACSACSPSSWRSAATEIGIRLALGARRLDVTWMVLREALGLGAGGVIVGAGLAVASVTMLRA